MRMRINKASMVRMKAMLKLMEGGLLPEEINLVIGGINKEEIEINESNLVNELTKTTRILQEIDKQIQEETNSREAEEISRKTKDKNSLDKRVMTMILDNMPLILDKDNRA